MSLQSLIHKGCNLIEKGEFKEAVKCFEDAVALQPQNSELYAYLGEAYFLNRQFADATKSFLRRDELVIENEPLTPYIEGYKGCIALAQGDMEKAISLLEKAISKNVEDPELYYNFGIARMIDGNMPEAYRLLRKIVRLDPSFLHRKIDSLAKQL